jgi:hypothetical protein
MMPQGSRSFGKQPGTGEFTCEHEAQPLLCCLAAIDGVHVLKIVSKVQGEVTKLGALQV